MKDKVYSILLWFIITTVTALAVASFITVGLVAFRVSDAENLARLTLLGCWVGAAVAWGITFTACGVWDWFSGESRSETTLLP